MDLGNKLFELRKSKNLSQEEVAEKLNVTRQTVSKWETNQSMPDFDKILPICELFEISTDELIKGEAEEVHESEEPQTSNNIFDEIKGNIFTRGKDDKVDYSTLTPAEIKRKTAEIISSSVLLFIIATMVPILGETLFHVNEGITVCCFLLLVGIGVARIIKHFMSIPEREKTVEEVKQKKIVKKIDDIIIGITVALYFIVSFATLQWQVTWVIFIIGTLVSSVVELVVMLKNGEEDEDEE